MRRGIFFYLFAWYLFSFILNVTESRDRTILDKSQSLCVQILLLLYSMSLSFLEINLGLVGILILISFLKTHES